MIFDSTVEFKRHTENWQKKSALYVVDFLVLEIQNIALFVIYLFWSSEARQFHI